MIARTLITIVTCLLLSKNTVSAQAIFWKAGRPLTWDDFKGKKPHRTRFAAATNSRLQYLHYRGNDDTMRRKIICSFQPDKSWKKNKRLSLYILKHEQTHFDIAELYTRKIRASFQHYRTTHKYNWNTEFKLKTIFHKKITAYRHYQHKYDRKTHHSLDKEEQEKWEKKVASQLSALDSFKSE